MDRKTFFLILYMGSLIPLLKAQVQPQSPKSDYPILKKWEIGAQFNWYVNKPIRFWFLDRVNVEKNIFFRRNYISNKDNMHAWRFRLGGSIYRSGFTDNINTTSKTNENRYDEYTITIAAGQEWHHLEGRWDYYYGYEAFFQYIKPFHISGHDADSIAYVISVVDVNCSNSKIFGLNGLLGGSYQLSPNLSFQIESVMSVYYVRQHELYNTCGRVVYNTSGLEDSTIGHLKAKVFPYLSLGLNYHFSSFKNNNKNEKI